MKKTTSKFDNIVFPLFGLKRKPYKIVYSKDIIACYKLKDSGLYTIDNKNLIGDYFSRLLQLENRLIFDFTCKSVQDIINTQTQWGIDSNGVPHDLSEKIRVKVEKRKIIKIANNLVWVNKISYPFELSFISSTDISDEMYAIIYYVNNSWVLNSLTYDNAPLKSLYKYI